MSEDMMFNVLNSDGEILAVLPRAEAVTNAKELSGSGNLKAEIKVESTDGMVSMTFFEGRLDIYVTETRDKRSRRRDRDESKEEGAETSNEGGETQSGKAEAADESAEA
jgi:hypothetical protein